MIDFILQVEGLNALQVVYTSGAHRYIFPDQFGTYGANMSKSQLEHMHQSIMYTLRFPGWKYSHHYYMNPERPNKTVLEAIRAAESCDNI